MDWHKEFEHIGALWMHDGNPKRPYALLTGGKISNFFFNGSRVIERPWLVEKAVAALLGEHELYEVEKLVVVGPAVGAIPLIYETARQMPYYTLAWFSEQRSDGSIMIQRFENSTHCEHALLVEDVITTGKSCMGTIRAVRDLDPGIKMFAHALCLVNRSEKKTLPDGTHIHSLLHIKAKTWERGANPFTPTGQEHVEPVRPKANWHSLTRQY